MEEVDEIAFLFGLRLAPMVTHYLGLAGSSGTYLVSLDGSNVALLADWDGGVGTASCSMA